VHQSLPLPQAEGVEFLFGVETEMTKDNVVAISPERYDDFAFVIIPVSHFHMQGFALSMEDAATPEGRANRFMDKMEALLDMPLPFHKIGLAHLANDTIGNRELDMYCQVLGLLMNDRMERLFKKAAQLGVGIELNTSCFLFKSQEEEDAVIDFYALAKKCGCKFYFGTDAHRPEDFEGRKAVAERAVELLGLTEDDKFVIGK
jgi:histidinol phosphatase-like PHP family hydrolase